MKNKIVKTLVTLVAVIITAGVMCTTAYAAIYSNVELEHIAAIPSRTVNEVTYSAVGGFATGNSVNSMFTLKAEKADQDLEYKEQNALFYDFPNIENPSNYHYYILPYAGHANGMAVDRNNIYVCGWTYYAGHQGNQTNNKYNNWIINIPRSTIASMRSKQNGTKIPKDNYNTEAVEGFSIMYPKVKNVDSKGKVTYTDYTKQITAIAMHGASGKFIVGLKIYSTDYFLYTTAELEEYNGKTLFVVSESEDDIFGVKNVLQYKGATSQDICYSPGRGLFIPRWYGRDESNPYYNSHKNVILWANIDGNYTRRTVDKYKNIKCYVPDKINVNVANPTGITEAKYNDFEIESLGFSKDGSLLFNCNITYEKGSTNIPYYDSIFKMTHDGGQQFTLN